MEYIGYCLAGMLVGIVIFMVFGLTSPTKPKLKLDVEEPETLSFESEEDTKKSSTKSQYDTCMDANCKNVEKYIREQMQSLPSPAEIFDALKGEGNFVYRKMIGRVLSILAVRVPGKIIIQIPDRSAIRNRLSCLGPNEVYDLFPCRRPPLKGIPTYQYEYDLQRICAEADAWIGHYMYGFMAEFNKEVVKRNLIKDSSDSWSPFAHVLFGNIKPNGLFSTDMNAFTFSLLSEADDVPRLTSNDTGTEAWVNFNTTQDIWLTENRRYVEELLKTMFTDPTNIEIFSKHVKQVLRTRDELIRKLDDTVPVSNVCLYGTTTLSLLMCEFDEIKISQNAITFGLSTPIDDYIKNIFEPEMFYELVGRYLITFLEAALSRKNSPCEVTTAVMSNDVGLSRCSYVIIGTKYPAGYHYFLNYDKPEEK